MPFRAGPLTLVVLLATFAPLAARAASPARPAPNPEKIIRKAVALQIANDKKKPVLRFTYTKTTPHGVFVKDVIETRGGEVSRLISINGKPLSPARDKQERRRLLALLSHPSDQARHRRHQMEDEKRVDRLIQELPDAFLFTFTGSKPTPDGTILLFNFVPNPKFSPPNLESRAFTGMSGSIWINRSTLHFTRLHAHLIHSIRVGWGIVAEFHQGGTATLVNQNIGHHYWDITHLKLDVDGRALIFKPIHIHITENESDFHFLPPSTTWQQAVHMLISPQGSPAPATHTATNSPAR